MMERQLLILERVAEVLVEVPQTIVFTGAATISLYLDAVSAPDIRPTDDVDCVVEIVSKSEYYRLSDLLRKQGLSESTESEETGFFLNPVSGRTVNTPATKIQCTDYFLALFVPCYELWPVLPDARSTMEQARRPFYTIAKSLPCNASPLSKLAKTPPLPKPLLLPFWL